MKNKKEETDTRQELKDYATEYELKGFILSWRGFGWSICKSQNNRFCYNKTTKEFILEPLPSNRTELFLKSCRFGLIKAIQIINKLNNLEAK